MATPCSAPPSATVSSFMPASRALRICPRAGASRQEAGSYRLERREDGALSGFNVPAQSWKQFLLPPAETLWTAHKSEDGFAITPGGGAPANYAFLGVHACDLHAIAIQDRVLSGGTYKDAAYTARRNNAFIVALNCSSAGGTCFCASMGTGPRAGAGYDLALTELIQDGSHGFLAEAGTEKGAALLAQLPRRPAEGADIAVAEAVLTRTASSDCETEFEELHVAHSTALHSALKKGGAYLTGPMARYALNYDRLPAHIQALAREAGLEPVCKNPFKSILVRAVEIAYACDEALRLIADYDPPEPAVALEPRESTGFGCTEAPRGICWHRYGFEPDGSIRRVRIVPPTSQNQACIEADIAAVAETMLEEPDDAIRHRCEQTIRNYDPCISCSTHFLKLSIRRS